MADKQEVRRLDYRPPAFVAKEIDLTFELGAVTKVRSSAQYVRQEDGADLVLNGEKQPADMKLVSVSVDGTALAPEEFKVDDLTLTIPAAKMQETSKVDIEVTIEPAKNTALSGLYKSDDMLCTQCEAEGFRNITYAVDRPDNMSKYRVRLEGDKTTMPVLLSNGDVVESGDLPDNRHFVVWEDPFPKPSYLFAVVAGDLAVVRDTFTKRTGEVAQLSVYVDHGNENQTSHAMESLKKAMKWDEDRFDRVYAYKEMKMVAVQAFNFGAMENATLLIFSARCVLASPETATDADAMRVEGIVAHEYFHAWSGNRVTCRDWFQLTLKEGLTVFRDQEFTSDMNSRVAKRIEDVKLMRDAQFSEDDGPLAHPIRPDSYIAIDSMYDATVYEKGAEVIRMMYTTVGREAFRKALNLYFERHDGQAVTCDDFCKCIEDACEVDLTQFKDTWYTQAGTPVLDITSAYDAEAKTFTLHVKQSCPPTPGQQEKKPFEMPLAVGLIGAESKASLLEEGTRVLRVTKAEESFEFTDIAERPVPSLLRDFSAPVKMHADLSREDLTFLAAHDTDEFVRFDSLQQLALQVMKEMVAGGSDEGLALLVQGLESTLRNPKLDKAVVAMSLDLPNHHMLTDESEAGAADVAAISKTCKVVGERIASSLGEVLMETYKANAAPVEGESSGDAVARRALKNACLRALAHGVSGPGPIPELARKQFLAPECLTDTIGALRALNNVDCPERTASLGEFLAKYKDNKIVLCKYLALQASSTLPGTLDTVKALAKQPEVCNMILPTHARSLLTNFANNYTVFHDGSGAACTFLVDEIIALDKLNPQVSARICKALTGWKKLSEPWSSVIKVQLERAAKQSDQLSPDLFEIVQKALK